MVNTGGGIERYADKRLNRRNAQGDAETVYNLMVDQDCGMFQVENVSFLLKV
ncbi:MAG: hypothetical protein U9N60_03465 [Thermodesulfobacteriota bacterium]|nr:hypothetical protein [Thermodesulfobacteriota bacterium]